ncbi:hypothetical protein O0L34_g8542 [Tuta absoluta]|nr:hypothetical protein O0L34_g8542 [Tuta absoluta]
MIIGNTPPPVSVIIQVISMAVLHIVAERHNFRFMYSTSDRWVGNCKPEDTASVSGSLYHGYHDITPVIRTTVCGSYDIIHPAADSIETRYFYRIPTHGAGKFENQFFRPLATYSWICVFFVISLCALALLLSAKIEHRPMPAQYAAFSVAASFCQQFFEDSGNVAGRRLSQARRMSIFVTSLFCLLLYNYYTSSVVSWLLNGPPPSINSLQELMESPLKLVYEDVGYAKSWLQNPTYYFNVKNAKVENEMRKKVLNKKKDSPLLLTAEEGIKMIKAGGFAFHTEVNTANMYISRMFNQMDLCELGSLQSMEKTTLYPAVQKNSPFREFFVWSSARLAVRGIISCIQHRVRSPIVSCGGSSPRALALGGAAPAFMLLAFGYLMAICILLLER